MAAVVAADVIIPFKIAAVAEIALAHVPIARGSHAVYELAGNAAPANQSRRRSSSPIAACGFPPNRKNLAIMVSSLSLISPIVSTWILSCPQLHAAGNRHHLVQVVLHKICHFRFAPGAFAVQMPPHRHQARFWANRAASGCRPHRARFRYRRKLNRDNRLVLHGYCIVARSGALRQACARFCPPAG